MIKVIKDNTIKQETCRNCKSILGVHHFDYSIESIDYNGISYSEYFICPCCGFKNYKD